MQKNYIIDTNVLIDDPKAIEVLRNGEENFIYIPRIVLEEIDKLKRKTTRLQPQVKEVINNLLKLKDEIIFFGSINKSQNPDDIIIDNIIVAINMEVLPPDCILVSNDKILRLKAYKENIKSEEYTSSNPFKSESEIYTGFINQYEEDKVNNCFFYEKGKLIQFQNDKDVVRDYEKSLWKVTPLTKWQNAFMMLLSDKTIPLVTVQSFAGTGKTFISLAAAMQLVFQEKLYKKIIIIKPNIEIGQELGFLPGDVMEKMDPYFKPIKKLLLKLHKIRPAQKMFEIDSNEFNENKIEMIPINYLRGVDIENAVVIFDEIQNTTRYEVRTFLSRMGRNVKCICTGDVNQIDNKYCNKNNNGLNWIVKKFKGEQEYAHLVLGGNLSRGPIANMVKRNNL